MPADGMGEGQCLLKEMGRGAGSLSLPSPRRPGGLQSPAPKGGAILPL